MIFKSFQRMLFLVTKSDIKFNCSNKKIPVAKLLVTESFQSPYLWQWKMGFGHHLRRPNHWMGAKPFFITTILVTKIF